MIRKYTVHLTEIFSLLFYSYDRLLHHIVNDHLFTDILGIIFGFDLSILDNKNSGTVLYNFRKIIRNDNNTKPLVGKSLQNHMNIMFGTDIHTYCRAIQDEHIQITCKPFCKYDSLLVTS